MTLFKTHPHISKKPLPTSGCSHSKKLFFKDRDFTFGHWKISRGIVPVPRSKMLSTTGRKMWDTLLLQNQIYCFQSVRSYRTYTYDDMIWYKLKKLSFLYLCVSRIKFSSRINFMKCVKYRYRTHYAISIHLATGTQCSVSGTLK